MTPDPLSLESLNPQNFDEKQEEVIARIQSRVKSSRFLAKLWNIPNSTLKNIGIINETLMESDANISSMVDRIYTIEEAAEVLKIKPRTVRQWISDGKIKAFKMGDRGLIRIHEEDLQAFIDQERRKS